MKIGSLNKSSSPHFFRSAKKKVGAFCAAAQNDRRICCQTNVASCPQARTAAFLLAKKRFFGAKPKFSAFSVIFHVRWSDVRFPIVRVGAGARE